MECKKGKREQVLEINERRYPIIVQIVEMTYTKLFLSDRRTPCVLLRRG